MKNQLKLIKKKDQRIILYFLILKETNIYSRKNYIYPKMVEIYEKSNIDTKKDEMLIEKEKNY